MESEDDLYELVSLLAKFKSAAEELYLEEKSTSGIGSSLIIPYWPLEEPVKRITVINSEESWLKKRWTVQLNYHN